LELEGLHTVETVMDKLRINRQSTLNLISKLKKKGHVTTSGGGRQKRIYKISAKKQRKREQGMFDIINKHSEMKLMSWYDHQVHGSYTPEDALVDAIESGSFRAILASMKLFNHIRDWPKLYKLANKKGIWQKVGALYDVARIHFRTRRMPKTYRHFKPKRWFQLTKLRNRNNFPVLQKKWKVFIPFNEKDILEVS